MTDDPPTDTPSPVTCTFTADELDVLLDSFDRDPADVGCSRPVWEETDSERCVWHAERDDKPAEKLAATVGDGDLTGAQARKTDLTSLSFPEGSSLVGADLTNATLVGTDLTNTDLRGATFTDSILQNATFTDAVLFHADLTNANLNETKLSGVALSRGTQCGDLPRLREAATAADDPAAAWDGVARTYHALKTAFVANGLIGRARDYHVLEQAAREREAKAAEGWVSRAYLGSKASRYLTGYGVRPSRVGLLMVVLFIGSTVVYWNAGIENPLRYSVTTFTTSPPSPPPPGILTQATAMVETFLGTLLIVLLGYVLGNRERFSVGQFLVHIRRLIRTGRPLSLGWSF